MAHPFAHAPVRGRIRWPEDRKPKRALAACLLALGFGLSIAGDAAASTAVAPAGVSESQLRAIETQALGAEHAAEHATQRAAARRASRRLHRGPGPVSRAAQVDPAIGGRWDSPFPAKTFGIHASLLPTGKVMFWGYPVAEPGQPRPNYGQAWLYDPTRGTGDDAWTEIKPPLVNGVAAPIYCSGQSLMADGRVLVAGGNLRFANGAFGWLGQKFIFTFDPWTESWVRQPDMNKGRWYPSQVLLPDGATILLGGYTEEEPGNVDTSDFEVFQPNGTVELKSEAARKTALYPHLFTMTDGKVLLAGPARGDNAVLNPDSWTWSDSAISSINRVGGSAVLQPAGPNGPTRVTQIGGHDYVSPNVDHPSLASTESLNYPGGSWYSDASLNVGRSYHNTVLLPDGSMVTVGGGAGRTVAQGTYATYGDGRARAVELWDPETNQWRLGAAQAEDRGYHSTAVLLPDGRVISSGDDKHPNDQSDTVEIYSPPYLFRGGSRPTIAFAPAASRWNDTFGIATSANVSSAVLVAPGQTTHGADMHQRYVELKVTERLSGIGVNIATPPNANIAPPGYYMLFIVDERGVPSVARWIRLGGDAPDVPILLPGSPRTDYGDPSNSGIPPGDEDEEDIDPGDGWGEDDDNDGKSDRDTTPPKVKVHVAHIGLRKLIRGHKIAVEITSDEPGYVQVQLSPRWLTFDRTVNFRKAGEHTIWFKPRLSARRKLKKKSSVTLTAKVWFRDRARNVRVASDRHTARKRASRR
jgi:hypothetical protein